MIQTYSEHLQNGCKDNTQMLKFQILGKKNDGETKLRHPL